MADKNGEKKRKRIHKRILIRFLTILGDFLLGAALIILALISEKAIQPTIYSIAGAVFASALSKTIYIFITAHEDEEIKEIKTENLATELKETIKNTLTNCSECDKNPMDIKPHNDRASAKVKDLLSKAQKRIWIMDATADYIVSSTSDEEDLAGIRSSVEANVDFRLLTINPNSLFIVTRGQTGSKNYSDRVRDGLNRIQGSLRTVTNRDYFQVKCTTSQISYAMYLIDDKMYISFLFSGNNRSQDRIHLEFKFTESTVAKLDEKDKLLSSNRTKQPVVNDHVHELDFVLNFLRLWHKEAIPFSDSTAVPPFNRNSLLASGTDYNVHLYQQLRRGVKINNTTLSYEQGTGKPVSDTSD